MSLYVYDQGYRIQTPKEALFPRRGINSLQGSRHAHRSADKEDQFHADGEKFVVPIGGKSSSKRDATRAYTSHTADYEGGQSKPQLSISHIMVTPVHTIVPGMPISAAWRRMRALEVNHLIVTEIDNRPIGLVSRSDLLQAGIDSIHPVKTIYAKHLIVATMETLVKEVVISFIENDINAVPVVGENDEVVGIVCRTDLLRLLISGSGLERWV